MCLKCYQVLPRSPPVHQRMIYAQVLTTFLASSAFWPQPEPVLQFPRLVSARHGTAETITINIIFKEMIKTNIDVRKIGHLNIKTKMLDIEARVLIGWYSLASQSERVPTRCFYVKVACLSYGKYIFSKSAILRYRWLKGLALASQSHPFQEGDCCFCEYFITMQFDFKGIGMTQNNL